MYGDNGTRPPTIYEQAITAALLKALTPAEVASAEWLGSDGKPGNIAANLESASQFLAEQKQIPSAAPLKTFQDAVYTKGLPDVLKQ